jgi:hypothetical protein
MATLVGGTVFGAKQLFAGVVNAATSTGAFSPTTLALLNEVGETILPTTAGSAGAKAANVAGFMQEIVRDFYDEKERDIFVNGLGQLELASQAKFNGREFMELKPAERHDLLLSFEQQKPQPEYYRMMKQLSVWGYFSSEVGEKQALNHLPVPGHYEGCVTIAPGTKAWAE